MSATVRRSVRQYNTTYRSEKLYNKLYKVTFVVLVPGIILSFITAHPLTAQRTSKIEAATGDTYQ